MIRYLKMGRIYAPTLTKAIEILGEGVVSIKPCEVQVRAGVIWWEYVQEVEGGE